MVKGNLWFMVNGSQFMVMMDSSLEERLQSFIECEGKSCSFDPELITPEYMCIGSGEEQWLSKILPLRW